jgi:hypothetical protein
MGRNTTEGKLIGMYSGTSITRGLFRTEILVDGGPQIIYTGHDGYRWIAGLPGDSYQIRVKSLAGRIGVALAIDGSDALRDQPADLANPSLQIIADKYTFKGFRVDDSNTRDFIFGTVAGSVADQAGRPGSIGTIGIAAWREQPDASAAYATYDFNTSYCGEMPVAIPRSPSLGTHAGDIKHDPVHRVEFERSGSPDVLEIGYNTISVLYEMGVTQRSADDHPRAFPGSTTGYEAYRP